jgi:hypothetical protein
MRERRLRPAPCRGCSVALPAPISTGVVGGVEPPQLLSRLHSCSNVHTGSVRAISTRP